MLVQWWINLNPDTHTALEGGPAFGYRKRGQGGGGQCDALLCFKNETVGVLEVEGTRPEYTVSKIGKFFAAEYKDLRTLQFGLVLVYGYSPVGRGTNRRILPVMTERLLKAVQDLSKEYSEKSVILLMMDKRYQRQETGIRSKSEFYFGEPETINGMLFIGGKKVAERQYWSISM